jgi:RNA polymerase sigma-70 factor (ECF subfamily)
MSNDAGFPELILRVRAGDADAAAEVVRRYEPEIRTDPGLRRLLDSMDVVQSVLGNCFVRAAAGQFDLERPEQLLKLLVTMARNKLRDQVSYHRAARRDQRRVEPDTEPLCPVEGVWGIQVVIRHIAATAKQFELVPRVPALGMP